jgi:hypothetical protein
MIRKIIREYAEDRVIRRTVTIYLFWILPIYHETLTPISIAEHLKA